MSSENITRQKTRTSIFKPFTRHRSPSEKVHLFHRPQGYRSYSSGPVSSSQPSAALESHSVAVGLPR